MPPTLESAGTAGAPPDQAADPPIRSGQEFCLALKAARARRGVTLAEIAAATKVCESHFAALERNDMRRWPKGIFRRAFFRGYVGMIGLPVTETMDEFARLFPDDEGATPKARPVPPAAAPRLSLDPSWHRPRVPLASRSIAAAIDAGAVIVLAAALAWWAAADAAITTAIASVSYFTLATVLFGDSPAAWVIRWRRTRASIRREAAPDVPLWEPPRVVRAWRRGIEVAALAFASSGDATPEEPGAPIPIPPRLRVRFKGSP